MKMTHSFDRAVKVIGGGRILIETTHTIGAVTEVMGQQIIYTFDEQVRAALVSLGWTPPKETT